MTLKVNKTVLGELYVFKISVEPNSFKCICRQMGTEKNINGIISGCFTFILLMEDVELTGYVNAPKSEAPKKTIRELKLSKHNRISVKEYLSN